MCRRDILKLCFAMFLGAVLANLPEIAGLLKQAPATGVTVVGEAAASTDVLPR